MRKTSMSAPKSSRQPVDYSESEKDESEYETEEEEDEMSPLHGRDDDMQPEYEEEEEERDEEEEEANEDSREEEVSSNFYSLQVFTFKEQLHSGIQKRLQKCNQKSLLSLLLIRKTDFECEEESLVCYLTRIMLFSAGMYDI